MNDFLKWSAMMASRILEIPFRLLPTKNNRIIFTSHGGRQYSCSPKSISDYLRKNSPGKYEIVWAFRDIKKFEYLEGDGIKAVPYVSLRRLFYEGTAKVSVCNTLFWVPFRKGQEHINTWHGGGAYKSVGLREGGKNWFLTRNYQNSAKNTSLFLSSCYTFTNMVLPLDFGYRGKVLECGMPRNDTLVSSSEEQKHRVREKIGHELNITYDMDLILYAPTWRYDIKAKMFKLDAAGVVRAYETRFHKKAVMLYRVHHSMIGSGIDDAIDATNYPDMQELLLACDMLISDYSSCIWDFSFTYKPCILYVPDLEKYRQERGFVKDISEWHFPYYEDNASLIQGIENFDEEKFIADMKQHHEDLGSCETGEATKIVCDYIYKTCFGESEKEE